MWFLRGRIENLASVQSTPINKKKFVIGRRADSTLCLPSQAVSGRHAELFVRDGTIYVRDLKSTNGTFLNGVPVHGEAAVREGDLLQFADTAFRVCSETLSIENRTVNNVEQMADDAFSLVQFDKLIHQQSVVPHYQPLVTLPTRDVFGYEVLGRSKLVGMETPKAMFLAASQLNMEAELSQLMRMAGMNNSSTLPESLALFLNTHPSEVTDFGLLESLRRTRENDRAHPIVLEIHEAAVTDSISMQKLRDALNELDIGLAYDDFGAGQSRLQDILDVPPDFLKFDMRLIRGIDQASSKRQDMLAALVRSAHDMGIVPLAEGVETEPEHEVITEMGFTAAQGYLYGRPQSADHAAESHGWEAVV